jgi:translationally-controlled tumor protein-like protein
MAVDGGVPYREQGESAVNDGGIGIENVAAEKKVV